MANFGDELGISVNYARYRLIQILAVHTGYLAGNSVGKVRRELREKLKFGEWLRYVLLLSMAKMIAPKRYELFLEASRSHPEAHPMPEVDGHFESILDVFNKVECKSFVE